MDWSTIFTIVLGSSFLGTILNTFVGWRLKRSENLKISNYIALKLAYLFEGFACKCLSAAEEHDLAISSNEHAGKYMTRVPEFSKLPEFDYQVFDLKLLDKVFDFPNQVIFANESISFLFDVAGMDEGSKEAYKNSLKLAKNSLEIADKIRSQYDFVQRSLSFGDYSVRDNIKERLKKFKK